MNVRKKLTFHFFLHFIFLLIIMLILFITALVSIGFIISQSEMKSDLTKTSPEYLDYAISIKESEVTINKNVQAAVLEKGGWLQIISPSGEVIGKYNTPEDLPDFYNFIDIHAIDSSKYKIYHWEIKEEEGSIVSVLYGEELKSKQILAGLNNLDEFPVINKETKNYLKKNNAWMQIYNTEGDIINSYAAPENLKFSFNDLLNIEKEPWNSTYDISSNYINNKEFLYLIGTENLNYSPDSITDSIINRSFIKGFILVSTVLVVLMTGLGFWYGKKFGIPLLYMMRWINNMSKGDFSEPKNKKGKNPLLNKMGHIDKKYKIFKDVLSSLYKLSSTLQKSKEAQMKMDRTREEWITGLTHDLKTPISSIYGYSTFLTSNEYDWTPSEIEEFGNVIYEKAEYMSKLIEDLNLTYRLKNDALPINKEKREIVSFFKEWISHFESQENTIIIDSESPAIYLEVDLKWFTRIINNLLVNAIKHNPVGTKIYIKISQSNKSTNIFIEDNGKGMDAETVHNLFNRYYRGVSTKESEDGFGLGMAIAHQLVVAHNGEVEVMSKKNEGTTIKLTFHHFPN